MKVILLWYEDYYVERTGRESSPEIYGVFSSYEALNQYLKTHWFDMPIDTRKDVEFSEKDTIHKWSYFNSNGYEHSNSGSLYTEVLEVIEEKEAIA